MTPTAPSIQIADVLATSLAPVLDGLCAERYGGQISLTPVVDASLPAATTRFHLHRRGVPPLQADFTVCHVGGTVYDVHGTVENGPSRTFTYCLPEVAPLVMPAAPHLAREVASFLLDALERRLGSDLLRADGRAVPQPPRPSRTAARR